MGLFKRLFGGGAGKDGVRGTAQVVSTTGYHEGVRQTCKMQLVIQAPEVPATAVSFQGLVHNKKWPSPGMVLPVMINPQDPERYEILWDEVERSDTRAARSAEGMAAALRGEGAAAGMTGNAQIVNLSGADLSDLPEEKKAKLRMLGIDPDQLAGQGASPAGGEHDDQLGRLERLAALHASGALTDAEFAEQKRRLLGG